VKDLIALFRLVENPAGELSWFRLLQLLDGVGPVTARRALGPLVASPGGLAGWPASRETLPEAALPASDRLVAALGDARRARSAGAAAETLRDALGPLIEARYADGAVRVGDLDRLVEAARHS